MIIKDDVIVHTTFSLRALEKDKAYFFYLKSHQQQEVVNFIN